MTYRTLITAADLFPHLSDPQWAVVDCSFSLAAAARGGYVYDRAHIPGAVYAHLDRDLSGSVVPGVTGRHPLPDPEEFGEILGLWGIDAKVQVVVYDDSGGDIASRLWWMLRWLGHNAVAVLDGGWQVWIDAGGPVTGGVEARKRRHFNPQPRWEIVADTAAVETARTDDNFLILDSRSADRFRGENEPIDPVAGHIPGAVSAPYEENLGADGRFLDREHLKTQITAIIGEVPPENCIYYCGSGVTSAHNLLALAHSGLGEGILYAGSWSQWITDPSRPVARILRDA